MQWAQRHPDIVNTVVFILYREPRLMGDFDFYANGKQVNLQQTYEESAAWAGTRLLKAADVVAKIREADPAYEPSAYLNGTIDANSVKWLIGSRIASRTQAFGYVTPRFMELVQTGSHLLRRKWLSYSSPKTLGSGRAAMLASSLLDAGMWKVATSYLKSVLRKPRRRLREGVRADPHDHSTRRCDGAGRLQHVRRLPGHDRLPREGCTGAAGWRK